MTYETIISRSFSKTDQRRLVYGAIVVGLMIVSSISTALKPYLLGSVPSTQKNVAEKVEPLCTIDRRSDFCFMNGGDTRINVNSSSICAAYIPGIKDYGNYSWAIRPYARKGDAAAMIKVREWTILPSTDPRTIFPRCTRNHTIPGILFSTGGYSGNNFHDFSDIIVPLFLTSRQYNGKVQFLVTDYKPWWVFKFRVILENLSRYELIDIDKEYRQVHCFSELTVGLKRHKDLFIDPSRSPYSMDDFRAFLRNAYSLNRSTAIGLIRDGERKRPRLLIVSRKRTRAFLNGPEIARLAESLGYEVVAAEAGPNTTRNAEVANSCDVMMGVHGAGLTNFVFLPENTVLIQIVPLGGMEWHSKVCFGDPARNMKMKYLEYKITSNESSLSHEYRPDHAVLTDPNAFHKGDWNVFKSVYLEKQNVELDLKRFRGTLLGALKLLQGF